MTSKTTPAGSGSDARPKRLARKKTAEPQGAYEWNSATSKPAHSQGLAIRNRQREYMLQVAKQRAAEAQRRAEERMTRAEQASLSNNECTSEEE